MSNIHPTAVIDPSAELGENVVVDAYAVIEAQVSIGAGSRMGAHSVIKRFTRMGMDNQIHEHAVIGGTPQDNHFSGGMSYVDIGTNNIIREGVTIHRATTENGSTKIGSDNFLMAYAHVAHDCNIGDKVVMANNVLLGGHVHVENHAFISGAVAVHQFCQIGKHAMVGGTAKVVQDCLPFVISDGNPARARGLNTIGLKRSGFSPQDIKELKTAYNILCLQGLNLEQALKKLGEMNQPIVMHLVEFVGRSKKGFAHHKKNA